MSDPTVAFTRAFVDAVEGDTATLIVGDRRIAVPATMLPPGAAEGAHVEIRIRAVGDPRGDEAIRARREKLVGSDDGGDIKL